MKYSFEFKVTCVELYKLRKWPKTPEGMTAKDFHRMIRKWVRISDANGLSALQHKLSIIIKSGLRKKDINS